MYKESAANSDIICRKIDDTVSLSIMPSNPGKKVFKAKSILKPKSQKKIVKVDKNKENNIINAQNADLDKVTRRSGHSSSGADKNKNFSTANRVKQQPKLEKKPKSLIPKSSGRLTANNTRKGEYQRYVDESKERERTIPTKLSSRRNSVNSTSSRPQKKEGVSKTELLYQQARMALGKSKKPTTKPVEIPKPPPKKQQSDAVLEVLKKQKEIRRNFENRGSFQGTSSRNSKQNSQSKEKRSFRHSIEKLGKQRSSTKNGDQSPNFDQNEDGDNKPSRGSKLSRKEARARIGLGDIPDEKIEEIIKVKKKKLKTSASKNNIKQISHPMTQLQTQKSRSRLSNDPGLQASKSNEGGRNHKVVVKELIKLKYPSEVTPRATVVRAEIPDCRYDQDMNSSINDFDEFIPVYQEPRSRPPKPESNKSISKYNSRAKEKETHKGQSDEDTQFDQEKLAEIEAKKELVKLQRKAKLKRMREEREKEKQLELKKKQNLEALNDMFKKRTENFKKKKEFEDKENVVDPFAFDEDPKSVAVNRLTSKPVNQSQDNFKMQHFTGSKLPIRHKTTKNSAVSSVTHSIQSPISKKILTGGEVKKKSTISDESTNASHLQNIAGRKTHNPKVAKKNIKNAREGGNSSCVYKVINIPSVKMDKNATKLSKDKFMDVMDIIPEHVDASDIDTMSVHTKGHKEEHKKKSKKQDAEGGRKVLISKLSKPVKEADGDRERAEKPKVKKVKKTKRKLPKNVNEKTNHSINMHMYENSIDQQSYVNNSYQQNDYLQSEYFRSDEKSHKDSVRYSEHSEETKVHAEIEYKPQKAPKHPEPVETQAKDWENIELFSSKKFSDIMAKHKKIKRYHDSEVQEEESLMDLQSNRRSNAGLHVVDIIDDDKDILEHNTYQASKRKYDLDFHTSPVPETFDKIRKVEKSNNKEIRGSRELKFEDLASSIKKPSKSKVKEESIIPSAVKMSNDKIFTTSINLMEFDLLSAEKQEELATQNNRTHDSREDSLTKAPNWNFIGSRGGEELFGRTDTSKKVIIDDFDEFKYEDGSAEEDQYDRQVTDNMNVCFDTSEANNSCIVNEDVDDDQNQKFENVSVFEDEEDDQDQQYERDHIPFHLDDEDQRSYVSDRQSYQETEENGGDTLKQMRMLFGSEQKIREQSEAAIKNLNALPQEPVEEEESEDEGFKTPGLSQSVHEPNNATAKSNVFDRKSFQEFSMKKFQEIMFDNNISEFMNSVERTVRENTVGNKTNRTLFEEKPVHEKSMTPKRSSNFVSPRKFSRKELELDRIVGSKMKFMSEKKKQRKSMLEQNDSGFIKEITQDPLNRSLDMHKSKYANFTNSQTNLSNSVKPKVMGSEMTKALNSALNIQGKVPNINPDVDGAKNKIQIERTEQVQVKAKLQSSSKSKQTELACPESIKRSDVRGLDVLLSEKSHEFEKDTVTVISRHEESDENKTLKYGTDERTDREGSAKSKRSQKEEMYGQLEKIMSSCFLDGPKESKIDAQDYHTLKYGGTDDNNEMSPRDVVSPVSSEISSPETAKRIVKVEQETDSLDHTHNKDIRVFNTVQQEKEKVENLITPRDNSSDKGQLSYRTPNSKDNSNNYMDMYAQKEMSKAALQASYETGRRENAFSNQFYTNTSQEYSTENRKLLDRSSTQDDNIRIYVDQWDVDNTDKKYEQTPSSDAYGVNESIGIQTAKNSPLESNKKDLDFASSEKYSVTEESAEKHLSGYKPEIGAFDYQKSNYNNIKRNLHSTLQANFENSLGSPDAKSFILNHTNSSQEMNDGLRRNRVQYEDTHLIPEYPNMVSPAVNEQSSPSNFDESK